MKVALVASTGGHLSELLRLSAAWRGHECVFVTTGTFEAAMLARTFGGRAYAVREGNRCHPARMARMLWQCARIVVRERPAVVVSTGAAPGCLVGAIGKALGARVVWIDSIANVERPSLSGRIVRRFADLFLVQWPHLAERYIGAECVGELV